MTNEEAYRLAMRACEETWNYKTCMQIKYVLKQKKETGHWILTDAEGNRVWHCNCSECGKDPQDYIGGSENWWIIKNKLPRYCPNCGVKMQEVSK